MSNIIEQVEEKEKGEKKKNSLVTMSLRLPGDLYEKIRYKGYTKRKSLNSVIVECLEENLPNMPEVKEA